MNLIEARKLAHEGWVRSPSVGGGAWVWVDRDGAGRAILRFGTNYEFDYWIFEPEMFDLEDWEPRPKPVEPFEAEVWVLGSLVYSAVPIEMQPAGWRKIRVREVSPPEAAGSSSSVFRCRKCGSICFTEQGATTCCWNHP